MSSLLLLGRVVFPDGSARYRHILIENGKIKRISRSRPPERWVRGAHTVVAGPQDWIFPGLIDLHTHASYNILPLWHSPNAPFDNRFEWRGLSDYKQEISERSKGLDKWAKENALGDARKVFSELQAVAGGTTVLDEPRPLNANREHGESLLLCRNTGNPADLGFPAKRRVRSVVQFYNPRRGAPAAAGWGKETELETYERQRKDERLAAILVHIGEGRSGFGSNRDVDAYSRAEIEALIQEPAFADAAKVREVPFSIVHGCGIDPYDKRHLDFLVERNISLVWSPVSNMLLYGDTLDVEPFLEAGINVALGSDWSPSGSKHVWEEAKFARFFLRAIGSDIADADIFRMITTNAGQCLNAPQLGCIEEGSPADLFVLRSPIESDNAMEVFFSTQDKDVHAVIVGGRPLYGDKAFLEECGVETQPLPYEEGHSVEGKAVHLPQGLGVNVAKDVKALERYLKKNYGVYRSNLLVSSDRFYQARMQSLRAEAEQFGWSVKRWKRARRRGKGADRPGYLPVPPYAVRVWCGFQASDSRDRFLKQLSDVFIPAAVQLQNKLGLSAYLPAVTPAARPAGVPDEVALVFFDWNYTPKKVEEAYRHMKGDSVAGRTFAALHQVAFRFGEGGSWSDFPVLFKGNLASRRAYYLFNDKVDWHRGAVRLYTGGRRRETTVATFHVELASALDKIQSTRPGGIDGALVAIEDDYIVYWEHSPGGDFTDESHIAALALASSKVMAKPARDRVARANIYERWKGVPVRNGDVLRLVFERSRLFLT